MQKNNINLDFDAIKGVVDMDLNIGDRVLVTSRWTQSVQTVDKITPKGNIRLSNGTLYTPDGYEKGADVWSSSRIQKMTPDMETQLNKEKVVSKALKVMQGVKDLSYEDAVKILNILNGRQNN